VKTGSFGDDFRGDLKLQISSSAHRFAAATIRHPRRCRLGGRRTLDEGWASPRPARILLTPPSRRYT
jgi:hypothetical protein